MRFRWFVLSCLAFAVAACSNNSAQESILKPKTSSTLTVQCSEFAEAGAIPAKDTSEGGNSAPPITWSTGPQNTNSFAILVEDSDADDFVHWVCYNIPGTGNKVAPSAMLSMAIQGKNSAGTLGYFGPQPPPGKPHHYHFHVYALEIMLPLGPGASKNDLLKAMSGHVLAEGELTGIFESK
jgi:Raf kinase inhibitor-like YbhB/YbcL family protein